MRLLKGNTEHVAPISAPILQIVPIPVHEIESTPGPKYSTIAPVPPFTVRMPASFRITSFGLVQPLSLPVSFTPITCTRHTPHNTQQINTQRAAVSIAGP